MLSSRKSNTLLFLFGISLLVLTVNISNLSSYLSYDENFDHRKILLLVFLLCIAGLVYICNVRELRFIKKSSLTLIITIGILMRLVCIFSNPVLEDDFYRYLWDGAVLANGENPYSYSPAEIVNGGGNKSLRKLALESGDIVEKINHPELRTIYPSFAQVPFAVSYLISPWNITAWKLILLFVDLITLILLLVTLRTLKLPESNILIYWWNPLLVKEIFNSGHMDALVFPFVLISLLLLVKNKRYLSTAIISVGTGIKLWPALLFPLVLKKDLKNYGRLIKEILLFSGVVLVLFLPVLFSNPDSSSGFVAYGQSWENNSSVFRLILLALREMFSALDIHPGHAQKYARLFTVGLLAIWILFVSFVNTSKNIYKKALLIVAFAFLISPTQFPWYYTWVVLFLTFTPSLPILSLTALLPFYYLRYHFEAIGNTDFFYNFVIWIEFVPVWFFIYLAIKGGTLKINQ